MASSPAAAIVVGVDTVDVNVAGLGSLAATCHQLAARLTGTPPAAPASASFQPSAAAALSVHADTAATDARFAARLTDTAGQLTATAARLRGVDETNAARIAAVAPD
jgi:hypothetical protein